MNSRFTLITTIALLTTNGCMLASKRMQAVLAPLPDVQQVQCATGCAAEWQRAQVWLGKHSKWKIQVVTDAVIQTYNPTNQDASYGFSIIREPSTDGSAVISIDMQCGNPLGCDPTPRDVRRAFFHYVMSGKDVLTQVEFYGSIR